jgi:Fanconi-associated nuclease 1
MEDISEQPCGDLSFFAQDHTHAELPELLECLSLEELRQLAKDMKIRSTSLNVSQLSVLVPKLFVLLVQRAAIEGVLIKQASSQSILPFPSVYPRSKATRQLVSYKRLPLVRASQCDRLRQMVMKAIGTSWLPQYPNLDRVSHRNMCPRQRICFYPSAKAQPDLFSLVCVIDLLSTLG